MTRTLERLLNITLALWVMAALLTYSVELRMRHYGCDLTCILAAAE